MAVLFAVLGLALFLPPPDGLEPLTCRERDGSGCRAVSGRVLYTLSKDRADPGRPLHLVLISRDSLSLPATTVLKIPPGLRPERAPGLATWVSAVGTVHVGSNGLENLQVRRLLLER